MHPLIQLKRATSLFLILMGFVWLGLLPTVQAVSPPPDGGYPGGNTAEGQAALLGLTTGGFNTAVGSLALKSNTTGGLNTGVGAGALLANTADDNTATGAGALLSNTTGVGNTADGALALLRNTDGNFNTAIGLQALENTTANGNTAIGAGALFGNTIGRFNTASGFNALVSNTTGNGNTANGESALQNNTTGIANTANGPEALMNNTTGIANTAVGFEAGGNVTTASNVICINSLGANVSSTCFIGNIRAVATQNNDAIPVLIDSAGQLGTVSSSRRFKKEIKPMDKASEAILSLKPVTFHYKSDNTNRPEFGLIAEEVAEVNPDLVVRDKNGDIYTVRYEAVNAMLLSEFLKEHRTVQEQQKEIDSLKAELKEQRTLIQKVSAQLEVSKSAPQTVLNNR